MSRVQKPTIGRIVIYKSKIDNGPGNDVFSPAIVIRTKSTTVESVVDRWGHDPAKLTAVDGSVYETAARPDDFIRDLEDDWTIDIAVFGLGKTYREYHVSYGLGHGQWQWPQRI